MDRVLENASQQSATASLSHASDLALDALAQQKIEARLRLLAMPPEEAQRIVEQTLYPQLWECRAEDYRWEESLPSHYGETNS
ncbi:hypothetical protein [Altericista sp. CCNU0014]|uniref:hypothetical protein n=1 Tax=Altericista sp. CCNU0014 TaxID=3082949 RepID=UPI00384BDD67